MANVPIILLAAGGSTRMGRPKQLLPWGNQTLIEHQIEKLRKTGNPVNIVLGANSNLIISVIEKLNVKIFFNNDWESGMGGSVSVGIHQITEHFPAADGVLITLLDQPLVTTAHLLNLLNQFQPGKQQIIVSRSASGWKGVPVLFDHHYFEELKKLYGVEGAKTIIQKYPNAVKAIDCNDQLEDIDTSENYQRLHKMFTAEN